MKAKYPPARKGIAWNAKRMWERGVPALRSVGKEAVQRTCWKRFWTGTTRAYKRVKRNHGAPGIKMKIRNLCKLGVTADKAYQWGNTRLGYWCVAGSPILMCSITNEKLALAGYFDYPAQYEQLRKLHLCD